MIRQLNEFERNAAILSNITKSLRVYIGNNVIELTAPNDQSLRDYVAEQFGIWPAFEDQEYSEDQRWAINSKLLELREYIMRTINS